MINSKDHIILDSFAGSGTTSHAVLNLNKEDGGNRKFILVEMEDYADNITAERIKRVSKGYGEGSKTVEGTGGDFDFYSLGEPLFNKNDDLNEAIDTEKIRNYIYYTETKEPLTREKKKADTNQYFLDNAQNTGYYFYYEKEKIITLNIEFLATIENEEAEQFIIYADKCSLDEAYMKKNNIIFKKIPRDITRF